jgi:hypothetical protein
MLDVKLCTPNGAGAVGPPIEGTTAMTVTYTHDDTYTPRTELEVIA